MIKVFNGDCLQVLKTLPDNSVDSLVTDPPAGISFMGKAWDEDKGGRKQWVAWMSEVMTECLRVLKPGAHGLVWAIPRTSHWTATALEDAGFEIRDVVTHIFGSGFPKSYNISKAIDATLLTGKGGPSALKEANKHRPVVSSEKRPVLPNGRGHGRDEDGNVINVGMLGASESHTIDITSGATEEAKQWQGWGTALKPASEHWILVRKPTSEKTVAANVLKHGVGGLNIDASRIEGIPRTTHAAGNVVTTQAASGHLAGKKPHGPTPPPSGRFPANLVLSHNPDCEETCTPGCAVAALDAQSGVLKSGTLKGTEYLEGKITNVAYGTHKGHASLAREGDSGGASRFFYCAKASKKDKGVDNTHPTIKSSTLMSYLIKLITPPEGIVLDPFMGSGSTGVSAIKDEFGFIGIEKELEYFNISCSRLEKIESDVA